LGVIYHFPSSFIYRADYRSVATAKGSLEDNELVPVYTRRGGERDAINSTHFQKDLLTQGTLPARKGLGKRWTTFSITWFSACA